MTTADSPTACFWSLLTQMLDRALPLRSGGHHG